MDESYFGGRRKGNRGKGAKNKIPVFGILEREGKVKVEIEKDVSAETLLKETIKKVKRGTFIQINLKVMIVLFYMDSNMRGLIKV